MKKLVLILFTLIFLSCQKEELSQIGVVKFTFINIGRTDYVDIIPQIFIFENGNNPLYDNLLINSKGETESIELNYGNYYLAYRTEYADNAYYLKSKVFQVMANKEINLIVDFNKD